MSDPIWVDETVNEPQGFRTSLLAPDGLTPVPSVQGLAVFQNPTFGRVMILDGGYQITERDEFIYHEMMSHVPMFAHGAPRSMLIIGGGDGGVAREALRHPSLERLVMVEIDRAVVDIALAQFPAVAGGAFDDPRLDLIIDDGAHFVASAREQFDIISVDAPDPVGAGAALFTDEFYAAAAQRLAPGGVMVTQSGMPFLTPGWLTDHAAKLRQNFADVGFYLSTVPSYTGGPMAHSFCSNGPAARQTPLGELETRAAALSLKTRYWTPELHRAAFALPAYISEIITPQR